MKSEKFEEKIKPLMDQIEQLCKEDGIEFLAEYHLDNNELYYYTSGQVLLDTGTIMTQLQLLEVRKGIKL